MDICKLYSSVFLGRELQSGRLAVECETLHDVGKVLERIREFGGQGWLCTTDSRAIVRFSGESGLEGVAGYPICGESFDGKRSLHVQKCGGGWSLAVFSREAAQAETDVVALETLAARDGGGDLRYETYWCMQDTFGNSEVRPLCFRFIGFGKKGEV